MSEPGSDTGGHADDSRGDGRRVLVTGGCGYIGSALVPRLLDDVRVSDALTPLLSFAR